MIKALFKSKKFKVAALAALIAFVASMFDIDRELARDIAEPLMLYVGGQSLVDLGLAFKGSKTE